MIPKIISLYLPQFHEVKENSAWYGEGFTDWVSVKNARPLFEGHRQPRKPLDQNYYDLSRAETIRWQAHLAKEYGIDGFCFYHYWFDSQNRLLEKPAELLLQHKEIEISFCFSWANESWKRTWSNVEKGNVWCDVCDSDSRKQNRKDRGLLVGQRYGREEEWKKHIEYLIPFFLDERYLKVDGKPVFCIYQPCDIYCMKAMLEVWDVRLKEAGLPGIWLIGASYGYLYSDNVDISYDHEPGTAFVKCREAQEYEKSPEGTEFFDYDTMWGHILDGIMPGRLSCAVTDFDASPRKGFKSTIVKGSTPERFENYFREFLERNLQAENELVLVNAWNEWGEGMYLEPCEEYGYGYLKAVKAAVESMTKDGREVGREKSTDSGKENKTRVLETKGRGVSRAAMQISVFNGWLSACRSGWRTVDFFHRYGYSTVAIYGMGLLGRQLYEELAESDLQVLYYIDRAEIPGADTVPRVMPEAEWPEADCIVITAVAEFETLYDMARQKSSGAIVNIRELFEDFF